MNVLVVSGLWPPDVGGPASHAPEFCDYLLARGHGVSVVTTADRPPDERPQPIRWVSRRLPPGARHLAGARLVMRGAKDADVVYSTGMIGRSSLGATAARTPIVLKLTSDPAFERSLRWGLTGPDLEAFQRARGVRIGLLRRARDRALARAARIVVPSRSLRELALDWGVPDDRIEVLPNPVDTAVELDDREELRRRHGLAGPTLVFAGRLVPQKSLDVALSALEQVPDVSLVLVGDGPDLGQLEAQARELGVDGRVRFVGARPRREVLELLKAADAAVLSSQWENFPHVVAESLAVGTPVLAANAGGVGEILRHGENGLLVPVGDPDALGAAIRRYFAEPELRERLRARAQESVRALDPEAIYARLERALLEAAGRA